MWGPSGCPFGETRESGVWTHLEQETWGSPDPGLEVGGAGRCLSFCVVPSGAVLCCKGWVQRGDLWEEGLWKAGRCRAWEWVLGLGTASSCGACSGKRLFPWGPRGWRCRQLPTLLFGRFLFGKLPLVSISESDWWIWAGWKALGLDHAVPSSLDLEAWQGCCRAGGLHWLSFLFC